MDNILQEYEEKFLLSKQRVLREIDEWTLYCFYLENNELELKTTYHSPIREKDDSPSFSIFQNTRSKKEVEYLWKDSAKNVSGDIFDLLCRMFSISDKEVLEKISHDFCILDDSEDVVVRPIVKKPVSRSETRIRYKAKEFTKEAIEYWSAFYITRKELDWKQVKQAEYLWFNDEQLAPFKCVELTFVYPEYNKKYKTWHTQVYIPKAKDKKYKFRNDLRHNQLYGNNHLTYTTDTLVITKSNKDILALKVHGVESVSARSETTPVKQKHIDYYKTKYKRVVVLYDNDEAGRQAASMYDLDKLFIPEESACKDFSDYQFKYGVEKSRELLIELNIL